MTTRTNPRHTPPRRSLPGLTRWALLAGLLLLGAAAAPAATTVEGKTKAGAFYRIDMPDAWNGTLVLFHHGWEIDPPAPVQFMGPAPLPDAQLGGGFAVAATSYSLGGFATFSGKKDVLDLLAVFQKKFGKPARILLSAESMGGVIALEVLETAKLSTIDGVLSLCGMVGGTIPSTTHIYDLRLIYDAVCRDVPGAELPGPATGLPKGFSLDELTLAGAVHACTGIFKPAALRTPEEADRLRRILQETTIPEDFLVPDMWFATVGVQDVAFDKKKMNGAQALGNVSVTYADPEIDAAILRVKANKAAARKLAKVYTPTGKTGGAKVLALHFDNDGLLFVEQLNHYGQRVPPGDFTAAVVREQGDQGATHCQFHPAERLAAWETLLAWTDGGAQPSAADVQQRCAALVAQGAAAGPCRIDPGFVPGDLSSRVKPR